MAGVAKLTDMTTVTGLMELYPGAEIHKQGSGTTEVMPSADLGQHHQLQLTTGRPPLMDVGTPGLSVKQEPLNMVMVQAPRTTTTSGLLPDASTVHWEVGFTPKAQGMWPLVEPVKVSQLNLVACHHRSSCHDRQPLLQASRQCVLSSSSRLTMGLEA